MNCHDYKYTLNVKIEMIHSLLDKGEISEIEVSNNIIRIVGGKKNLNQSKYQQSLFAFFSFFFN